MVKNKLFNKSILTFLLFILSTSCSHVDNPLKLQDKREVSSSSALSLEDQLEEMWVKYQSNSDEFDLGLISSDLFFKANDAAMRGDGETSTLIYSYLVRFSPEDLFLKKKYAIELVRIGKLEESEKLLKETVLGQGYKEDTTALLWGGVLTALGKEQQAVIVYKKLLKQDPSNEEACVFLSKRLALQENYKAAHRKLKVCESHAPEKGIFAYYRGKLALKEKKYNQARMLFKKSLKREETFYQSALALGLMLEEKGKYQQALKEYKKYLKNDPHSYAILSRLVQLKFSQEDYDGIIPYAERLSALDQSDLNLKVKLGILYSDAKKYDDAIGVFKEVLTVVPGSDKVLYYLGALYRETSNNELALETFAKVKEDSSLYLDSTMQLAQILKALVSSNEAQWENRYLSFLDEKRESSDELRLEMGILKASYLEEKGLYSDAISSIELVRSEKNYNENHDYYLASLYEKVDKRDKARVLVGKMLDKDPNNAHALNYIGYSLLEEGQSYDEAYSYIFKAVQLSPKDGYIRDSLAWYFYKKGNYEQALIEIKKASDYVKDDAVINKHMAMIYTKLNKYELAREFYNKALKYCNVAAEKKIIQEALEDLASKRLPASR